VANGYGLAMWRNSCCFCPEPLPNIVIKLRLNYKSQIDILLPELKYSNEQMSIVITSARHIAKPNVVCSFISLLYRHVPYHKVPHFYYKKHNKFYKTLFYNFYNQTLFHTIHLLFLSGLVHHKSQLNLNIYQLF
jgi:hypothetical protein